MALHPLPLPLINSLAQAPPNQHRPTLWTELEPLRREQLAQHLARLINRIRVQGSVQMPVTTAQRTEGIERTEDIGDIGEAQDDGH